MPTISSPTSSKRSRRRRYTALALWLLLSGLFAAGAFYSQDEAPADELLYDPDVTAAVVVQAVVFVALAIGVAFLFRRPWRALGFTAFRARWIWFGFGVVVGSLIVSAAFEPLLHGGEEQGFAPDRWDPDQADTFVLNSIMVTAVGPFAEEVFFRGLGVKVLSIFGATAAIVLSAVVFGLVHGIPAALPPLIVFALGLAWLRVRSGSIWPGYIAHVSYNGLGILVLVLVWTLE